jgi:DNA primase
MPLPRQIIDEIRARVDIVDLIGSYITLKRAGSGYKALCPFHREKTPSFTVNPARQIYHCFGCGAGGDVFKFVMQYENVEFMDAVRLLAQRAGVSLQLTDADRDAVARKDLLYKAHEEAARFYHEVLLRDQCAEAARAYLRERQIGPDAIEQFGLGFAPGGFDVMERFAEKRGLSIEHLEAAGLIARNESGRRYDRFRERLMFPIRDLSGRVIAFSGRILGKDERAAKYLNSPETPLFRKSRTLYAMDRARHSILESRCCLLCEGQIDVIRCHLAGFTNAVAALGTAITNEHAAVIKRHADRVILLLDADSAGRNSALRSAEIFLEADLSVSVASLPTGEDPDSLIVKRGAEALRSVLENTRSVVAFQVDTLAASEDITSDAGLRRIASSVLATIRHSSSKIQRARMLRELSTRVGIPEHHLQEELARGSGPASYKGDSAAGRSGTKRASATVPAEERELLRLLVQNSDMLDVVQRFVRPDHIQDARVRALFIALARDRRQDLLSVAREAGDQCLELAAEIMADEKEVYAQADAAQRAAQDLVIAIRRKALERELRELSERREAASGAELERLTGEIAHLRYTLAALRRGWDVASLALAL